MGTGPVVFVDTGLAVVSSMASLVTISRGDPPPGRRPLAGRSFTIPTPCELSHMPDGLGRGPSGYPGLTSSLILER